LKARAVVLAALLVQCAGAAPPAPSPAASSAPAAAAVPAEGSGPGPEAGGRLPAFEAPDEDGKRQDFETLRGKNGLLLNFNRSVVW
jgi:cytochrome oxidase Cu insertion factor (SCO1/SenC/PrrC family)